MSFPLCSHPIPNAFSACFPSCSVFATMFPIAPHFLVFGIFFFPLSTSNCQQSLLCASLRSSPDPCLSWRSSDCSVNMHIFVCSMQCVLWDLGCSWGLNIHLDCLHNGLSTLLGCCKC
jgi:hypothetical protein